MTDVLVTLSKEAAGYVHDLIRYNIDSAQGYGSAADLIEDKGLAGTFREFAAERDANAEELKAAIAYNGDEPPQSGTTTGTLHRWWLELKGKVTTGDTHSVLSEAERGEDTIKHSYEKAIKAVAASPISELLTKQYAGVKKAHDYVRDLRNSYANKK